MRHSIRIILLLSVVSACDVGGGASSDPGASPSGGAGAGSAIATPTSFEADAQPFVVTLTWQDPAAEVDEYRIYRDEAQTVTIDGSATSHTDETVRPGRRYVYEIEAVAGEAVSERTSVWVKAPKPPLAEARLEGDFDVRVKPSSSHGYVQEARLQTMTWTFEPRCSSGPCRVRWTDLTYGDGDLKATLSRSGKAYRGSARARRDVRCDGTATVSSVEVRIRVAQARPVGDVWRATRIRGRMVQAEEPQLGCVASGATFSISGRFLANLNP